MTKRMIDADELIEFIFNCDSILDLSLGILSKINELATPAEPQESIFDADGWCWDMNLAPHDGCNLLLKNYNSDDFFIMYDCYKETQEDYWRSHSLPNECELWNGFKTDDIIINNGFKDVSLDEYEEVAWQPLPKLPTGGKE
jgi:hypothetical protein